MKNIQSLCILGIVFSLLLTGCSNVDDKSQNKKLKEKNIVNKINKGNLKNTYSTNYGEANAITFPSFSFDYPEGWKVETEEITPSSERVVISNNKGVEVTYWYFGGARELTGATRAINVVDVTKVTDANFIPEYVQAEDHSSLGNFVVGKLDTKEQCDMLGDGEFKKVEDDIIRYALLPESEIGQKEEMLIAGLPTFSFWYSGHISLIASSESGKFSDKEEKEVVSIISSFRTTTNEKDDNNSDYIKTIDDLWDKLKGKWKFEEYIMNGENIGNEEHVLELRYIDNKPALSRIYDEQDVNIFFYDFSIADINHYTAYVYKRDAYGEESPANWGDDVVVVSYSFDLTNISNDILSIDYKIMFDNGFIDTHTYKYSKIK